MFKLQTKKCYKLVVGGGGGAHWSKKGDTPRQKSVSMVLNVFPTLVRYFSPLFSIILITKCYLLWAKCGWVHFSCEGGTNTLGTWEMCRVFIYFLLPPPLILFIFILFAGGGVPQLRQKCLSEINVNSDRKENWRHQRRSVKPDVVSMEQPLRQETESFGVAPTVHPSPSVATLLLLDAVFWMTADGTSHRIGTLKSTVLTWTDEIN